MNKNTVFIFLTVGLFFNACKTSKQTDGLVGNVYTPESQEVYDVIVSMDKKFFDAYNTCDIPIADSLLSEDIEFYHDLGGLSTSKTQLMDGLKNNICGKVTRVLQEGSIEVYPIKNYGAVQIYSAKIKLIKIINNLFQFNFAATCIIFKNIDLIF